MATSNLSVLLAQATDMIDEVYEMTPVAQEARFGATAKHITKETPWKGGAMHRKVINQQFSRTLASADLESDAPYAGRISTDDIEIQETNLRKVAFTVSKSIPAAKEVDGSKDAVWALANELVLQAQEAIGEKRNAMIHQDANAVKALVKQKYALAGSIYVAGQTTAFLSIDNGSISSFKKGEILNIRVASTAVIRLTVQVDDVHHDRYYNELDIGPGIVCSYLASETAGTDTDFDLVVDNDEIVAHGEVDGVGFPMGFAQIFTRALATAGDYFSIVDRGAAGHQYLIPYGRAWGGVDLDIDVHFGTMADTMGMVFGPGREYRRNRNFQMTEAIVGLCQPDLFNEVTRQAGNASARFTMAMSSSIEEAKRRKLVGLHGWTGAVLQHGTLPPIALQSEPLTAAGTIRLFEPSTYEFIRFGGKRPQFIPNGSAGGIWHARRDATTGNLTMLMEASGFVIETLYCDQPRLAYSMEDLISSI